VSEQKIRPTDVTIIAILNIISGIMVVAMGVFPVYIVTTMTGGDIDLVGVLITAGWIALGIALFAVSWGLLKAKPWAWTGALILAIIGLVAGAIMTSIVGILVEIGILYYLFKSDVREYFGKSEKIL